jgi:hypothetical protein
MALVSRGGWTLLVNVYPDEGRCVAVARWCRLDVVLFGRVMTGVHQPRRRRTLDLSPLYAEYRQEGCKRVARRWALANGFVRRHRRKASERRLRQKLLSIGD